MVSATTAPSTIDVFLEDNKENDMAIGYYADKESIHVLEDRLAELTERRININIRKTGKKELNSDPIRKWDLSKINFDNIEYKK